MSGIKNEKCIIDLIDDYDDKKKNGIKTYTWGEWYWGILKHKATRFEEYDTSEFKNFLHFFMTSPQDLLPCRHCRKSFAGYLELPEYDIDMWVETNSWTDFIYLIHGVVNRKLGKVQPPSCFSKSNFSSHCASPCAYCKQDCHSLNKRSERSERFEKAEKSEKSYEVYFWKWIFSIAWNYPADIQLIEYSFVQSDCGNADQERISKFTKGSKEDIELRKRMKTYILFFDLLKNFIDRDSPLLNAWLKAYIENPPTPYTFSSRTALVEWLFGISKIAGYHDKNKSFMSLLEEFHPTRSTVV